MYRALWPRDCSTGDRGPLGASKRTEVPPASRLPGTPPHGQCERSKKCPTQQYTSKPLRAVQDQLHPRGTLVTRSTSNRSLLNPTQAQSNSIVRGYLGGRSPPRAFIDVPGMCVPKRKGMRMATLSVLKFNDPYGAD